MPVSMYHKNNKDKIKFVCLFNEHPSRTYTSKIKLKRINF